MNTESIEDSAEAEDRDTCLVRAAGRNEALMQRLIAHSDASTLETVHAMDLIQSVIDRLRKAARTDEAAHGALETDIAVAFAQLEGELRAANRSIGRLQERAVTAENAAMHYVKPLASATWPPDAMDLALWRSAPVVCVPRVGEFSPLPDDAPAHRLLVADTGLWLECRRPWLHLIWPVAPLAPGMEDVALPYGSLTQTVKVAFGRVPHDALREFADLARRALPNESGAWMAWETYAADVDGGKEGALEWCQPGLSGRWNGGPVISNGGEGCVAVEGTPGRLDYPRPETTDTSTPCIDIHSHGAEPAFFSETDNADDRHDVKIAIVVGSLERPVPTIVARLCCLGVMIPIRVDAAEVFGRPE